MRKNAVSGLNKPVWAHKTAPAVQLERREIKTLLSATFLRMALNAINCKLAG